MDTTDEGASQARRRFLKGSALALAAAGLPRKADATEFAVSGARAGQAFVIANTTSGRVRGLQLPNGVVVFKGVRYGADTSGDNRFVPAAKITSWQGVKDATGWGARSPQIVEVPGSRQALFWDGGSDAGPMSEDCLVLNIWTPAVNDRKHRPVIVRLHGGDFFAGTGNFPMYAGLNISARGDIVFVNLNHRLGAFGHLDLSSIGGDRYASSGNLGILDLVAALEWIRDNIHNFGGDPANVTIVGEAGGGSKVYALLGMSAAKGLFHRAIVESCHGLKLRSREEAGKRAELFLKRLGLNRASVSDIHRAPLSRLIEAQYMVDSQSLLFSNEATTPSTLFRQNWGPVLDGYFFTSQPLEPTAPKFISDVPLITGYNRDEATLFLLNDLSYQRISEADLEERINSMVHRDSKPLLKVYRKEFPSITPPALVAKIMTDYLFGVNSLKLADRKSTQRAPVYFYRFDWETPALAGKLGATHNIEIPFANDTGEEVPLVFGGQPGAQQLARQMSGAWAEFARSGRPRAAGLPDWPVYSAENKATMAFNTPSVVLKEPMPKSIYRAWDEYGTKLL